MADRIKGTALALTFGGTDYWADASSVILDNEDAGGDVTTFADAAAGGARKYFFTVSATQSTQAGSFWRYLWANVGTVVAYRYAPHGNAIATADQPHFTGTVKIGPKPRMGGEAGQDKTYTFEVRLDCQEEPTLDVGASAAPAITSILPADREPGQAVQISGTRFTGASAVKFGTVEASSVVVVSDTTIVAVIPAGTGAKSVTVVTPAGTSAGVSYTVV